MSRQTSHRREPVGSGAALNEARTPALTAATRRHPTEPSSAFFAARIRDGCSALPKSRGDYPTHEAHRKVRGFAVPSAQQASYE
ncbi:hypothetical protein GCM10029992_37470 [Glycomyces albus]